MFTSEDLAHRQFDWPVKHCVGQSVALRRHISIAGQQDRQHNHQAWEHGYSNAYPLDDGGTGRCQGHDCHDRA
jgi:hypothetical protein